MAICTYCGRLADDTHAFCSQCGNPIATANQLNTQYNNPVNPPSVISTFNAYSFLCEPTQGKETTFPLYNTVVVADASLDAFNYYRKQFSQFARLKANDLRAEYCTRIFDLDSFLLTFPEIYQKHRKPLINTALDILCKSGVYDVSPEAFEEQHTADFCLCGEDINTTIESFNLTIEENQNRKVRMYNMMPGVIFSGIGGFAAALAMNVAVNAIAEADIRNANVSQRQRAELFSRINFDVLMERAYIDYWRVFLSLTYALNQRGFNIWYPTEINNNRANGLYQNLISGRIPQDQIPAQTSILFSLNPYADEHLDYLKRQFGITAETQALINYFSV